MTKEITPLSEKEINTCDEIKGNTTFFWGEDVKLSVKQLKERLTFQRGYGLVSGCITYETIIEEIDKIMGKELT